MQKIISICINLQLLYLISRVESQTGAGNEVNVDAAFKSVAILQRYPEGLKLCGGTLVTKKHLITTRHCIGNESPENIRVTFKLFENPLSVSAVYSVASLRIKEGIAVVELADAIYQPNVKPVRLSELKKKQVVGKKAIMIGWHDGSMGVLHKTTVKILSDEECLRNIKLLTNRTVTINSEFLCTVANTRVPLHCRDGGAPILDSNYELLGVNFGNCPDSHYEWGNFSEQFSQTYRVNIHFNTDYYRKFIDMNT